MQDLLELNVQTSYILMGVGAGSARAIEVQTSGEKAVIGVLRQKIAAPYCIFDVGSNRGQYLRLILENIATEDYSIHCFEPGHSAFRSLAGAFQGNTRIKLNNFGLGEKNAETVLYYDSAGSGCASLTKRKLDHLGINFDQSERVTITTLDDYCAENKIDHIHLLKMDIEGHELDALTGAKQMFASRSVDIVTFEFGGCNVDTRSLFRDFWYFFQDANMKLFRITPSGYLYPIEAYSEIHEKLQVSNFMALLNR